MLPHTCRRRPETPGLGENCPRLLRCLEAIFPLSPCTLIRFALLPDGSTSLPFATGNFEAIQLLPQADVRNDTSPLFSLLHPEDFEQVLRSINSGAHNMQPFLEEYRIIEPATKNIRWLRTCLVPYPGTGQEIVGYGVIADVTAGKIMHKSLITFCDQANIGVFRISITGRYQMVNQNFARMCGYGSPQEFLACCKDFSSQYVMHPEERETLVRLIRAHGSVQRYALEMKARTGASVWISLNLRAVTGASGIIDSFEGYCADITSQTRQELLQGGVSEFEQTRFGPEAGTPCAAKPAETRPDGLCSLMAHVRDTILWRLRLPQD